MLGQKPAHGAFAGAHESDQDHSSHLRQKTGHIRPSAGTSNLRDSADLQDATGLAACFSLLVIGAFSEMNLTTEGPQNHCR
jgi:hypothetical protein